MNISSAIVHARPGAAAVVRGRLAAMGGVEVHGASDDGRFVVTIEADDDGAMAASFEAINRMDDVLSAAMVFHQTESDPAMEISV